MRRLYFTIYAVFLILFGLLGYLVHKSYDLPGDVAISDWFTGIKLPFVDSLMRAVSSIGDTIPAVIIVLFVVTVLLFFKRRLEALYVAALLSLAALFIWLIKVLVDRPRPGYELLGNGGLSFPSGHVSYIVVLLGFLIYLLPGLVKHRVIVTALQAIMVILILLMMASRIYLGEHWPSDVLGGIMLGGLMLVPVIILYNKYTAGRKDAGAA
ncbi:MAG: phosphatase PAP2 family protein [Chloroflexota bacterium]